MNTVLWVAVAISVIDATIVAVMLGTIYQKLAWMKNVLLPWINAINTKLELPK